MPLVRIRPGLPIVEEVPAISSMTRARYDAIDAVNFSTLRHIGTSPAHYRERKLRPDTEDTDARKLGRAIHIATFEPHLFESSVVRWEGGRRVGKEWDQFKALGVDFEILTIAEHAQCLAVSAAVRGSDQASRYLMAGAGEQTVLWTHERESLAGFAPLKFSCKGRVDWIGADAICDLKTGRDASPDAVGKSCWNFQSHVQAAFYVDGYRAATGRELPYVLIAVETHAPYVVQCYRVPDDVIELGREQYRTWLDRLDLCRREGRWPGYADAEMSLALPRWAVPNDDSDLDEVGLTFGE